MVGLLPRLVLSSPFCRPTPFRLHVPSWPFCPGAAHKPWYSTFGGFHLFIGSRTTYLGALSICYAVLASRLFHPLTVQPCPVGWTGPVRCSHWHRLCIYGIDTNHLLPLSVASFLSYAGRHSYFSFAKVAQASSVKYQSWTPYPYTNLAAAFRIFFLTAHLKKMGYSTKFACYSLSLHDCSLLALLCT